MLLNFVKRYSCQIIFVQIETSVTIRVWWALIEEVAQRPIESQMACHGEKEVACCARDYTQASTEETATCTFLITLSLTCSNLPRLPYVRIFVGKISL